MNKKWTLHRAFPPLLPGTRFAFILATLIDNFISRFQSFLSLIRLHIRAVLFFSGKPRYSAIPAAFILGGSLLAGWGMPSVEAAPGIPILCYHQVSPKAKSTFEVSSDAFRTQMAYLQAGGFAPVNGEGLLHILSGHTKPLQKPVVISFDDGYRSVYDHAFPIMREFGFVGVACVYPQFIGTSGGMTWGQLQELASAGWSIECHSLTHADLSKVPSTPEQKEGFYHTQIARPKQIIEQFTGQPVRFMVWPYGIYTEEAEQYARKVGYLGALTVDGGSNYSGLDPFRVKRQVVYKTDDMQKFAIRVEMGPLEVTGQNPRPGQILSSLPGVSCEIPALKGQSPLHFVVNPKVTGGKLEYDLNPETGILTATPTQKIAKGSRFIDMYVRDKRTGITSQHGWFFIIR